MDIEKLKPLAQFLAHFTSIPREEELFFLNSINIKSFKAGDLIQKSHEEPNGIYFVMRGLCKTVYSQESGKEWIKGFAWEGKLLAPYAAILMGAPSNIDIVAIEDTDAVQVPVALLETLFSRHECWQIVGRKIAESIVIEREMREAELLIEDATTRYLKFKDHFSAVYKRLPQFEIASYLGITPVGLSKLRKKLSS